MRRSTKPFALCINNEAYLASLIAGKVYRIIPDAAAAKDDLSVAVSRDRDDLVPHEMQANLRGRRAIEKASSDGFDHVFPQFVPVVALREDVFRQTFGTVAAVGFLNDFKDEFGHHLHHNCPCNAHAPRATRHGMMEFAP